MPPDYGMPYGAAPAFCFPLTEICVYLLLIICVWHSLKHNGRHLGFMLGGIVFGLLLEFVDVYFLKGYTYGRFMIMLGKQPDDIPLWIGVGWGIIMYSSRLFTDRMGLPLFAAAAFDAFLALIYRPDDGCHCLSSAHVGLGLGGLTSRSAHFTMVWHSVE